MANEAVGRLKKLQAEAQEAFDDVSLAHRDEREQTRLQRFLHFWLMVVRSFSRNRCPVRAASLAYASLLAIVPMLAVVIGVSSTFLKRQGEQPVEQFVARMVASVTPSSRQSLADPDAGATSDAAAQARLVQETRQRITQQIMEFVGNMRGGALSATGLVALLAVVLLMLARIEDALNDIWGVTRGRPWHLRIIQYWFAISLGPLLLIATAALTSGPYLGWVRDLMTQFGVVGVSLIKFVLFLLPYVILSTAFGLLYLFMPNTRVHWSAAAVGGAVAGVAWQLNQVFSVFYVSRVVSNTSIYGSLGAVPVFMVGLYVSWILLLFGAQVAYAYQNRRAYLQERQVESINQRSREFVALRLMAAVSQRFQRGEKPPSLAALADAVGVPSRLANQTLTTLARAGLVAEVAEAEAAFVPARPLGAISARDVLQAMRSGAGRDLTTRVDATRAAVLREFEIINAAENGAAQALSLEDLVKRLDAGGRG